MWFRTIGWTYNPGKVRLPGQHRDLIRRQGWLLVFQGEGSQLGYLVLDENHEMTRSPPLRLPGLHPSGWAGDE